MAAHPIILIVDDHDDGRDLLSLQLRLSGYRVMSADGMEAALALARTVCFDLYILDHCLKDGSGTDLRRCLLRLAPLVPAIIHTGRQYDQEQIGALRENGDEYLGKPAELGAIQHTVAETLRSASARKSKYLSLA